MNQKDMVEFNQYNTQLNMLGQQISALKNMLDAIKSNIKELKDSKEEFAYKNLGLVLVKKSKEELIKDLEKNKESIELRIKTFERQEKIVLGKLNEIKEKMKKDSKAKN